MHTSNSLDALFPADTPGITFHFTMELGKGKDGAVQADKGEGVITKLTSENEVQDDIVYPNVFWTSCVSFGVALGLFLVSPRRDPRPAPTGNANNS